ncbi:PhzF family phenazine biosynthesis protein [uncultured Jatrophihabitans sp.]|uniref:PhzF family phenazine biosynthesis protein n=1 Tax=uncultured Jatrophihabitans sp. TaxID=1610747 RepID=UPI0035CC0B82
MRVFVVDAFTDTAFRGNPAGVVLLTAAAGDFAGGSLPPSSWMQDVATELRHSETAFVVARPDGSHDLRWFTPLTEVDLCGHATLATTHVLAGVTDRGTFDFHTRSGLLHTSVGVNGSITMDFPAAPLEQLTGVAGLQRALRTAPVSVHRAGQDVLVELADADAVARLDPDLHGLAGVEARGIVVTAAADAGADHDFVSRFFAPQVGVDEDPVTGSAHCALAPFWSARLGRTVLTGVQLSPRGGRVGVEVMSGRVRLHGRAVTVLDGTLRV